jgi:hypothetical protein
MLEGHGEPDLLKRLEADAGRFFGARNRTKFCECRVVESNADIQFEIDRGSIPRRYRKVVDEVRVESVDLVPARTDLVLFDKRTRMLSVHAQQAAEHDYYRRLFGRIFFGNEDHFRIEEIYTGEPLALRGEDALSVHGFPHLDRIELRELRVQARAGFEMITRGSNTREALPMIFGDDGGLSAADVQLVKLAIYVKLRRRPIIVSIKPRLMFAVHASSRQRVTRTRRAFATLCSHTCRRASARPRRSRGPRGSRAVAPSSSSSRSSSRRSPRALSLRSGCGSRHAFVSS